MFQCLFTPTFARCLLFCKKIRQVVANFLFVLLPGSEKVISHSRKFEAWDAKGKLLLSADSDGVYLGAEKLTVAGM